MAERACARVLILAATALASPAIAIAQAPPSDPEDPANSAAPLVEAAPTVASPDRVGPESHAELAFKRRCITFDLPVGHGAARPCRSVLCRPLSDGEFYALVGRPDAKPRRARNDRVKRGLSLAGGIVALAGAGALLGALLARDTYGPVCGVHNPDGTCAYSEPGVLYLLDRAPAVAVGIPLFSVGSIVSIAGLALNPRPIPVDEARQLARAYNRTLLIELVKAETGSFDHESPPPVECDLPLPPIAPVRPEAPSLGFPQ